MTDLGNQAGKTNEGNAGAAGGTGTGTGAGAGAAGTAGAATGGTQVPPVDDKDKMIVGLKDEAAKRRLHERDLEGKLDVFQKQDEETKRKKLEEEGKYKDVLIDKDKQIETLTGTVKSMRMNGALQAEAVKQGIVDMDYLKLIPSDVMNNIALTDGKVSGAEEAVKWLIDNKPNVKADNSVSGVPRNIGGAGSTDGSNKLNPEFFTKDGWLKQSVLTKAVTDPVFYKEHGGMIKEYTKLKKIAPGV